MKLNIPDEDVPLLVTALEHYYAYTVAKKEPDTRYEEFAELLKRQVPPITTRKEKRT